MPRTAAAGLLLPLLLEHSAAAHKKVGELELSIKVIDALVTKRVLRCLVLEECALARAHRVHRNQAGGEVRA
eukprot:2467413-Rhodomonas_salina.1